MEQNSSPEISFLINMQELEKYKQKIHVLKKILNLAVDYFIETIYFKLLNFHSPDFFPNFAFSIFP